MSSKPYVWQMIKEACNDSKKTVITYKEIKQYIFGKYGEVNPTTITCQIIVCSVNHKSRIHYPENQKERICESQYDFLYNVGRGQVELFDPHKHRKWEIAKDENNTLIVRECGTMNPTENYIHDNEDDHINDDTEIEQNYVFPLESQLRDFIARNVSIIDPDLNLYANDDGIDGVEFRTDVGNIDILAEDKQGNLVVFELKLSMGFDRALGQIQRYMGWLKKHLAKEKGVRGIIIAKSIDDKLKYAVSVAKDIQLFEYEINFDIRPAKIDD